MEKYKHVYFLPIASGKNSVIKLTSCKNYVVKYIKKNKNESQKEYLKRVSSEFCINNCLDHDNVIKTFDFFIKKNIFHEIMEYLPKGDLFNKIKNGINENEIEIFYNDLISGVKYIHSQGIAHKDLKPENLLLTNDNHLKITDFGSAEVIKNPFSQTKKLSNIKEGTLPYMAPEEFIQNEFDPILCDVWAYGIIYIIMIFKKFPWGKAISNDNDFEFYLLSKEKYPLIYNLPYKHKNEIYNMLAPDPLLRTIF